MSAYRSVAPAALTDNFFSRIGEDWMLITAANSEGEVNTMTASRRGRSKNFLKNFEKTFQKPIDKSESV